MIRRTSASPARSWHAKSIASQRDRFRTISSASVQHASELLRLLGHAVTPSRDQASAAFFARSWYRF